MKKGIFITLSIQSVAVKENTCARRSEFVCQLSLYTSQILVFIAVDPANVRKQTKSISGEDK